VVNPNKTNRVYSPFESTTEDANVSINFENRRGSLPWPADQGFVSTHFGRYQVPGTQLWGDMPGIEISLPVGSNIKAVADGVVSAIFDLGGGQTVVIRHGKYFTTYNNLSSTDVNKGQDVKAGKVLGKAAMGTNGDGQIIFMVTNDKNVNLNPESWLKQR
jgi:murein DD-endopeptidase MepM/ murein hydrolase activator NlpD